MPRYHRDEVIGETVEKLMPERTRARHMHDRDIYNRFNLSRRARHMGGVGTNLVGVRSDGHEFLTDITLARMIVPRGVYNLALVRFSGRAMDFAVAEHVPAETDQNLAPEIDEFDANR